MTIYPIKFNLDNKGINHPICIKIKLKMNDSNLDIKLAMYYSPLAQQLNEERLENIPDDVFIRPPPETGRTVKSAPLLDK